MAYLIHHTFRSAIYRRKSIALYYILWKAQAVSLLRFDFSVILEKLKASK